MKDNNDAMGAISQDGADKWEWSISEEQFHVKIKDIELFIKNDGTFEATDGQASIKMTGGKFTIGSASAELLAILGIFMTKFLSHTHPTGVGPAGPPLPPELTDVTAEKAKLDTITG